MADKPAATVVWTGLVPTTTGRRDKRTGKVQEYRVVLFSDGTSTCDCPAKIFYKTRNREAQPGDRERYECPHITLAMANQRGAVTVTAPRSGPTPGPTKGEATAAPDDFLSEFEDDALLDLPQIRNERQP